jgi:hypothetical protein
MRADLIGVGGLLARHLLPGLRLALPQVRAQRLGQPYLLVSIAHRTGINRRASG